MSPEIFVRGGAGEDPDLSGRQVRLVDQVVNQLEEDSLLGIDLAGFLCRDPTGVWVELLDSVEEQTIIRKERTKWKQSTPSLKSKFGRLKSRQLKF